LNPNIEEFNNYIPKNKKERKLFFFVFFFKKVMK